MRRDRLKAAAVVEARISAAVAVAASEPAVLLVEVVAAGLAAPHRRAVVLQFAVAQVAAISPQVRP
jgi:hypothetical protein